MPLMMLPASVDLHIYQQRPTEDFSISDIYLNFECRLYASHYIILSFIQQMNTVLCMFCLKETRRSQQRMHKVSCFVKIQSSITMKSSVLVKMKHRPQVKLQLHDAIYRLRFYSNSLIHILSLLNSHNNVASIQKNRGDKSHRVIVA